MAAVLEACPVCRQTLDESLLAETPPLCPGCGTDLTPFMQMSQRSEHLALLGLEWLSRGRDDAAREVVKRLTALHSDPGPTFHELAARLALQHGDLDKARRSMQQASPDRQADIELQLQMAERDLRRAWELYNYALSSARDGNLAAAADSLERAVEFSPHDIAAWQLKAKVDLKAGLWARLYEDLRTLDAMGARPEELGRIERLLPALPI